VVSPILSNIYLHKLDEYVETVLIPQHTQGTRRRVGPQYNRLKARLVYRRRRGDRGKCRELRRQLRRLPTGDPQDPGYRRLRYSRYADDHLLGFIGPKAEAEHIKDQLARFLRDELHLNLSPDKTLITHARTRAARYLSYEITTQHNDQKITGGQRSANGIIALRVPKDVIKAKSAPYRRHGKPWHRPALQNLDDYNIVRIYGAEYRGVIQYYQLAQNVSHLHHFRWNAETSMLKTLAAKHNSTVRKIAVKHKTTIDTARGRRVCFEAGRARMGQPALVARFGGIPLIRNRDADIIDRDPASPRTQPRKELITRLRAGRCEWCHKPDTVVVHHVRTLASLGDPGPDQPAWAALMAAKRRKTLVVCEPCHETIHG
jgi:hypothetical protein